mmetsp:Transcript_26514/g.48685  ORF Transcript_26514/g.48685 Transcript_26514/m.48685 type:complete len:456 (-) Transcript_26514:144-1511(-)
MVTVNGTSQRRPRTLHAENAIAGAFDLLSRRGIQDDGLNTKEGEGCASRLKRKPIIWQRSDNVGAGLSLPEGIDDGAVALAHDLVEPLPPLNVDGLPHGAEDGERGEVVLGDPLVPGGKEGSNQGGGGVEDTGLVALHDAPDAVGVGVRRRSREHDVGGSIQHGTISHVGVTRDPAAVRSAPVKVSRLKVEDVLGGESSADHVTTRAVDDTLRLAGGSGGVKEETGVLGINPFNPAVRGLLRDGVGIPNVTTLGPLRTHLTTVVFLGDDDAGDNPALLGTDGQGLIYNLFGFNKFGSTRHARSGENHLGLAISNTLAKSLSRETGKNDAMKGTKASACKHGNGEFGVHGQVHGDSITLLDALALEVIGNAANLLLNIRPGHNALEGLFITLPNKTRLVSKTRFNPAIYGIIAKVGFTTLEKLYVDRTLARIKIEVAMLLVKGSMPVKLFSLLSPE